MEYSPESLQERRTALEQRAAELAAQVALAESARTAIAWEEEFYATLELGGKARSARPYDFDGVWHLAEGTSHPYYAWEPVVSEQELPAGVNPHKRVVSHEELITGTCAHCGNETPLLGRGSGEEYGFGDITAKSEIALIHCNQLQPFEDQGKKMTTSTRGEVELNFSPYGDI